MIPLFATPTGVIDGINAEFVSPSPYTAGSLAVLINGQLIDFSSFTETDPQSGMLTITDPSCIPRAGAWGSDRVDVFYIDTSSGNSIQEVRPLTGTVTVSGDIQGAICADRLLANVSQGEAMSSSLVVADIFVSTQARSLTGIISE